MLWMTSPGLRTRRVRDHRVVLGVGVLLDIEVPLHGAVRVGEERPLGADRGAELLAGVVVIGRDRRDLRVGDGDLRIERGELQMLLMLLGAEVAAGEREDQRVVALYLAEPAHGVRVVGQLVVGEHAAGQRCPNASLALLSSVWSHVVSGHRRVFDVVVDAHCGQPPVRAAFVDCDAGLGRHVMAAPADAVVLHGAAHAVVGHDAVLQADTATCAEALREERAELAGAAVDVGRADRLAEVPVERERAHYLVGVTRIQRRVIAADDIARGARAQQARMGGLTWRRPSTGHWLQYVRNSIERSSGDSATTATGHAS